MVARRSPRQNLLLQDFGADLRRWRVLNGLSASALAERSGVTRETLRRLEVGDGSARLDSVVAVLSALGIADTVLHSADPFRSDAARARIDEILGSGGNL